MSEYSVYIHIPFCVRRCAYCDFFSTAGSGNLIPAYIEAVRREIDLVSRAAKRPITIKTVYFGGGTPSLLDAALVAQVISTIRSSFLLTPAAEISLEANPGTVSSRKLEEYRTVGVNRISLGMQSAQHEELRLLGRLHSLADVINAVKWARQAGFDNLNLDLIFGIPGQSLNSWQHSVKLALELLPEHLSLYCLTIEEGTRLAHAVKSGAIIKPDDDLSADQFEWAIVTLEGLGFQHYEISNWANDEAGADYRCQHNLQYWRNQPYFGFGAGAHGYLLGKRTSNALSLGEYITRVQLGKMDFPAGPAAVTCLDISTTDEINETMMMGLRLLEEGINKQAFLRRFGVPLVQVYEKELDSMTRQGLIENTECVRLTRRGMMLANQVVMRFLKS